MSDGSTNLEFTAHVFSHVTGVMDCADLIEEILAKSPEAEHVLTREVMEVLATVLRGDAKLIQQLFEENQYMVDRITKAFLKNHPKGYTITNTEGPH